MELDAIRERLENLTFVHGDLRDLKNYQPIDALYLSNAFEHSPHDRAKLDLSTFTSLVPPDGPVVYTVSCWSRYAKQASAPENWIIEEVLDGSKEPEDSAKEHPACSREWAYCLAKRLRPLVVQTEGTGLI